MLIEMPGDRWSVLIIRDTMLRGASAYREFLASEEGIATNILADRLRRLVEYRILTVEADSLDGRKRIYRLTRKGIALAPVLTEMAMGGGAQTNRQSGAGTAHAER